MASGSAGDNDTAGSEDGTDASDDLPSRRTRIIASSTTLAVAAVIVLLVAISASRAPTPTTTAAAAAPTPVTTPAPGTTEATTTTSTEPPPPPEIGTTTTTRKPRRPPTGPPGPLTGMPVDLPGYERRPALVVKIDNADPDARPQAGLTLADIVYEEKVEGPISRFAAIFQGSDADQIGPVRSARSTDVEIVGPLARPLFGYSGANGGFSAFLTIAPLIDVGAESGKGGAYWRGGDKAMPHNLYTSTANLYSGMSGFVPPALWGFRGPNDPLPAGARPASSVSYHFGGGVTSVTWTWDPQEKAWGRMQNGSIHYDMDNWPVTAANVVIQYVPYQNSFADDMFGNPIPEASLGGTGTGWVMTGGPAVPMRWARYSLEEPTKFVDANDELIRFAPGKTWVILVPQDLPATVR